MCFYRKEKDRDYHYFLMQHILEIRTHLTACELCLRVTEGKEEQAFIGILTGIHKWEVYQGTDGK